MKRACGIFVCLLILLTGHTAVAATKAEKNFQKLAADILKNLQEFWPVNATAMGVHTFDDRFGDYSRAAVDEERRQLRDFLARLYKYKGVRLAPELEIDHQLVASNCEMALLRLWEVPYHKTNPNLYLDDAANGIYYIMIRDYAPMATRLNDIIARMWDLQRFLTQAEANLSGPPPIWLDYAKKNVTQVKDFYITVSEDLASRFPARADEISSAANTAVTALDHYAVFLGTLEPGEPGSFALGKDYYDYMLEHDDFFSFNTDSLLTIGENLLAEALAAYNAYEQKLAEAGDTVTSPIYVIPSLTGQDVIDYYNWEINTVKQFVIDNNLVSVPPDVGPCVAVETPKFLRGVVGGIAYEPAGPFDTASTGYFYVRPIPDSLTDAQKSRYCRQIYDRGFRGSVVHEAYPGHHLQLQLAAHAPSDVRRWQMNYCLIEGWALYCEQMAYEAGLYPDQPRRYLGVLGGIVFRAARIVVDVKLHTGQFNYDQAVDWMIQTLDADSSYIQSEVLRYTMMPGQPMSYLMGKRQIMELRDEMKAREGEAFDLKRFHDRLLSEGSIPVPLIRKLMLK